MEYFTEYKGIKLKLIERKYGESKARRFLLIPPANIDNVQYNQNVWIPLKHLQDGRVIRENENIDYVFRSSQRQLELSGYYEPIIGVKRRTYVQDR